MSDKVKITVMILIGVVTIVISFSVGAKPMDSLRLRGSFYFTEFELELKSSDHSELDNKKANDPATVVIESGE